MQHATTRIVHVRFRPTFCLALVKVYLWQYIIYLQLFFLLRDVAKLHNWASKPLPTFFSQHSVLEIGNIFLQLYYRVALELQCFCGLVQHFASVLLLSFARTSALFTRYLDTSFQ